MSRNRSHRLGAGNGLVEPNHGGGGNRTRVTFTSHGGDTPAGQLGVPCAAENLQCTHLTKTYWAHERPSQCGRSAQYRYGSQTLCWQHAQAFEAELRHQQRMAEGQPDVVSAAPEPQPAPATVWAYFIRVVPDGPIKIGSAVDPVARLKTLQTASAYDLELLAVTTRFTEQELHARFADHRLRGEWFAPVDRILSLVQIEGGREAIPFTLPRRNPA